MAAEEKNMGRESLAHVHGQECMIIMERLVCG